MGRTTDSLRLDLHQAFLHIQAQMLAHLASSDVFEHPTSNGSATEQHWITLLNHYLPQRYRATSAFIVDADGRRSRQIDIAVYDHFYSPLLFHHDSQPHIPAESVYAVFEVKPTFSRQWLRDAHEKAASVRALASTPLDLGCALQFGAFDRTQISTPSGCLIFFLLRLIHRLQLAGTAPAIDWTEWFPTEPRQ